MSIRVMNPSYIIDNSTPFLSPTQKKLTKFVYHFTDVNNGANILNNELLLSRNAAISKGFMLNDNAAEVVIAGTDINVHDCVRFYFRPKTPTQFQNEGIRSKDEYHSDYNAHCPIPIFFLFDIDEVITDQRVYFSYESLASRHEVSLYNFTHSPDSFKAAPFNHIYHNGWYPPEEWIIKKRRHAEVIVRDEYDLSAVRNIYCRNENEAITLKSLLSPIILKKYGKLISVPVNTEDYFNDNYLTVKAVYFKEKDLIINWKQKKQDSSFNFRFEIYSSDEEGLICKGEQEQYIPYIQTKDKWLWRTADHLKGYDSCIVKIYLDSNLVYKAYYQL
ncbi:hypothetical protein CN563_13300 [Bacillus sp. AFS026049]|uniref:DarT ssDNA thymidine ADP-ribosyltransferase family protein n=1 Tax=Peribacillus frigoritolerans TaxID=450367 RepID=UPI000BF67686|nr:hypothetical protein CN563_13300 [Bacillus sp. AFS026049]